MKGKKDSVQHVQQFLLTLTSFSSHREPVLNLQELFSPTGTNQTDNVFVCEKDSKRGMQIKTGRKKGQVGDGQEKMCPKDIYCIIIIIILMCFYGKINFKIK